MKTIRLLAWMLVLAMLAAACPAFGEALEVELPDGGALEAPTDDALLVEGSPADLDLEQELSIELSGDELSGDLADALEGGEAANDAPSGELVGHYQSQGGYDNDALFAGYVDMLFGKNDSLGIQSNGWVGDRLTGPVANAYNYLVKKVGKVAAGTLTDTRITIPSSVLPTYMDVQTVFNAMSDIIDALLLDCPYHMFWYDKTQGVWYGTSGGLLSIHFNVASEYAAGMYKTNAAKIKSVHVAVTRAKNVVKRYAGASDYEKLCGYRDYICDAVSYNDDAITSASTPYGNPWQLIWAFDADPTTNIVCEGYSKAFQYLCDLSSFNTAIHSHIVTGTEYDSSGSGLHMWNIVTMGNGRNYHVDITFVDGGYTAAFLCGADETAYQNTYLVRNELYYQLDSDTVRMYPANTLKLSASDYITDETVAPKRVKLKKGGTTLKKGQRLSLKRGKSMKLRAVVYPAYAETKLTWTSSSDAVTVEDGVVTVSKSAKAGRKAKITVTTSNGKSMYIYIVVK